MVRRFPLVLAQQTAEVDLSGISALDWITAGAIVVGAVLLSRVAKTIAMRLLARVGGTGPGSDAIARLTAYVVILLGLFYALNELGVRVGPLVGALGLGGIMLALAAQGPLENVLSGFLLQSRREFKHGDLVESGGIVGSVEEINARAIVLRALSGEQHVLPNAYVINNPFTVFTDKPIRRSSLIVGVEYRTDLARARDVLIQAARAAAGVVPAPAPDAHVRGFEDSAIEFDVRFWHGSADADRFRATGHVAVAIKQAFDREGITIAFPQRVLWPGAPFPPARDEER